MNANVFLELSAGIYKVQNMHLFKPKRLEAFSSFGKLGGPDDSRNFPEQNFFSEQDTIFDTRIG